MILIQIERAKNKPCITKLTKEMAVGFKFSVKKFTKWPIK